MIQIFVGRFQVRLQDQCSCRAAEKVTPPNKVGNLFGIKCSFCSMQEYHGIEGFAVVEHWDGQQGAKPVKIFKCRIRGGHLQVIDQCRFVTGINLPKAAESGAFPDAGSLLEALDDLRHAVARTKSERMEAVHPAFGKMTHEEWNTLHLRHLECT